MPRFDFRCLLLVLAAIPLCGAADHSVAMALAFQSTIVSTYADGQVSKLWLNPDGTYTDETRRHAINHGHWAIKGDRICLKQNGIPLLQYCTAIPSGDMNTVWSARAVTGEPITLKLVPGRGGG